MKLKIGQFIKISLSILLLTLFVACGGGGGSDDDSASFSGDANNPSTANNQSLIGTWEYEKFNQEGCEKYLNYNTLPDGFSLSWRIVTEEERYFNFISGNDSFTGTINDDGQLIFERVVEGWDYYIQDIAYAVPEDNYSGFGEINVYTKDSGVLICEGEYEFVMRQISISPYPSDNSGNNTPDYSSDSESQACYEARYWCEEADKAEAEYQTCLDLNDSPYDCNHYAENARVNASRCAEYTSMCNSY